MPLLLATIEEEDKLSRLRVLWRYRLQFQALASASVIFTAGGMKLAWSVFEAPTGQSLSNSDTHRLTVSWFAGATIGAFMAALFVQRVTKNAAHFLSGALLILGGLVLICAPTQFVSLLCSCLLEGCAFGINQLQALVTGAEVARKEIRGLLLSSERIFLWLGICLQLLYTRLWFWLEPANGYALHVNQPHGVLILLLGITAVVLARLYRFESPLLLKTQQRDLAATYVIKRLQCAHYPSIEVTQMREECKQLLNYDAGQPICTVFWQRNALPLLKVITLRCFVSLSLTLPFNRAFLTASWTGFGCSMNCAYLLAFCGLTGSIFGALIIDKRGRRCVTVISLLLASIFTFIVGGVLKHLYLHVTEKLICNLNFEIVAFLLLLYQLVTCAGVAIASTVYLAEAFTMVLKAKCIAAVVICEHLLHIALALMVFHSEYNFPTFFFIMGSLSLLLGLLVLFFMPETKYLSLHECLLKFRKVP